MTVKELKKIINEVNGDVEVKMSHYGNNINGYYFSTEGNLILTELYVQPRITGSNEIQEG